MILGLNADGITDAEYEVLAGLYADMGVKDAEAFIRLLADKTGNVDGPNGYTTWTFDGEKIGNLVKSLDVDSAILIQKQHLVRILDNESIEALYAEEFGEGDSTTVEKKRSMIFNGLTKDIFALQHKSALLFAVGILENGVVEYNKFETTKVLDGIIGEKNADNPNIKLTVNENKDFVLSFEQSRIVMDADQRLSSQVITREVKVGYYIDGDSSTSISDKLKSEYYHIKNAYDIDDDLVKKLAQKDVGKFFGLMLKELPFVSLAYDISSILGSVANNKLENDKAVFELTQLEKSEDTANYAALFDLNVNLIYSDPEKPGQTTVLLQNSTATTDILNELNATLEGKFEANPRYFEKYREYGLAYPLSIEDVLNFPKQIRKMEGDMLDSVEHFRIFSYPPVSK
jgi:DNA-dependent RNA polymerase auxiliary subunit epsilon